MDPEDPSLFSFLVLFVLLLFSGFFSGSEVSLVSVSKARARSFVVQKKRGAHALEFLKNHPDRLLITILIGNNLVNILIPVLSTVLFTQLFGNTVIGLMTGILTLILLLFGEVLPKSFAQKHADPIALLTAPIIYWLSQIFLPLIWPLEKLIHSLSKNKSPEKIFSDEELLALAEIGEREGALEADERERIENVLEFGETTAEEVMTPRPNMDALSDDTTLEEAIRFFLEKTHSRIPVFSETIDRITSIITLKNILKYEQSFPTHTEICDLPKNPPLTVPVSMLLEDVMKEMKWRRTHMAIVIDEHGGTAGLVTLEDLLEEVFGEIEDETDKKEEEIRQLPDGSFLVSGNAYLEDIQEATGLEVPGEEADRIAKAILENIGRFPKRGETIHLTPQIYAVIEKMDGHKIRSLRLFSEKKHVRKKK
ncbi:HlyC/CorC family transporter [Candidatus Peregrinibacteria bacterium]|nr:MAG: HlyC/CorC family transporter [Candidatus Peregrinibacteria bacterium]